MSENMQFMCRLLSGRLLAGREAEQGVSQGKSVPFQRVCV